MHHRVFLLSIALLDYKRDLYSLDFIVNRFFMKLFRTSDISVVAYCGEMFQFDLPSAILKKRL